VGLINTSDFDSVVLSLGINVELDFSPNITSSLAVSVVSPFTCLMLQANEYVLQYTHDKYIAADQPVTLQVPMLEVGLSLQPTLVVVTSTSRGQSSPLSCL